MAPVPSVFGNLFKQSKFDIAVVQFKRRTFSVGQEEELHWALIAFPDGNVYSPSRKVWQAINGITADEGEAKVQWTLKGDDVEVVKNPLSCLGGVKIGEIRAKDVQTLDKIIQERSTGDDKVLNHKDDNWNCRNWVMETIHEVLIPNGWANASISERAQFFPLMKKISKPSEDATRSGGSPVIADFEQDSPSSS